MFTPQSTRAIRRWEAGLCGEQRSNEAFAIAPSSQRPPHAATRSAVRRHNIQEGVGREAFCLPMHIIMLLRYNYPPGSLQTLA